jgi:hypothetical protein
LRVGQRSQPVIIFLSSSIPQSQADGSAIYHHTGRIVVKSGSRVNNRLRMRSAQGRKPRTR